MKCFPLIGIMVARKKNRIKMLEMYHQFWNSDFKIQLCSFTPASVSLLNGTVTGIIKTSKGWDEVILEFPDAIYNRCYNKSTQRFTFPREIKKRKIFNTITHFNKWDVYTRLKQSDSRNYLPQTFLYDSSLLPKLLDMWKIAFLKPSYGNKGRNVYRLELTEHGSVLISTHSLAPRYICGKNEDIAVKLKEILGDKQFIMQKGIVSRPIDKCYFDLRVLMQKNIEGKWMVTAMVCRVAYEDFFNTSVLKEIYDAELFIPNQLNAEVGFTTLRKLNAISIGVAEALDKYSGLLGELSIDFILDEFSRPWIIEVNGKPQKSIYKGIEDFRHQDLIYQRPLEYAYYLSQLPSVK